MLLDAARVIGVVGIAAGRSRGTRGAAAQGLRARHNRDLGKTIEPPMLQKKTALPQGRAGAGGAGEPRRRGEDAEPSQQGGDSR
jgi:hypothetical protein